MKKSYLIFIISLFFISTTVLGQNLFQERIWKLVAKKRSVYIDRGIFHYQDNHTAVKLLRVRRHFSKSSSYERLVFDFDTNSIPRLYGRKDQSNKLYLDFFNTTLSENLSPIRNSEFVKTVDVFAVGGDALPVEVNFKKNAKVDVFYLKNPGRLVIDIK